MNNGCDGIFQNSIIIIAIVFMVIVSIAGVSSMGFVGILAGPVAVAIGWIVLSWIFS